MGKERKIWRKEYRVLEEGERERGRLLFKKYEDLTTGWNPLVICSDEIKGVG